MQSNNSNNTNGVEARKWLLTLCERIPSDQNSLGTKALVRAIWDICSSSCHHQWKKEDALDGNNSNQQQQQSALFDLLGSSDEAIDVLFEICPRIHWICENISLKDLDEVATRAADDNNNEEQEDKGGGQEIENVNSSMTSTTTTTTTSRMISPPPPTLPLELAGDGGKDIVKREQKEDFPSLHDNLDLVREIVKHNGLALKNASAEICNNRQVVMIAVQQNGLALRYASQNLRQKKEVVLAAVSQNTEALKYAFGNQLKQDPDCWRAAKLWLQSDHELLQKYDLSLTPSSSGRHDDGGGSSLSSQSNNNNNADDTTTTTSTTTPSTISRISLSTKFSLNEDSQSSATQFTYMLNHTKYFLQRFMIYSPNAYSKNTCDDQWTRLEWPCRGTVETCQLLEDVDNMNKGGRPTDNSCWRYSYRYHLQEAKRTQGFMLQVVDYDYEKQLHILGNGQQIEIEMANQVRTKIFRVYQPIMVVNADHCSTRSTAAGVDSGDASLFIKVVDKKKKKERKKKKKNQQDNNTTKQPYQTQSSPKQIYICADFTEQHMTEIVCCIREWYSNHCTNLKACEIRFNDHRLPLRFPPPNSPYNRKTSTESLEDVQQKCCWSSATSPSSSRRRGLSYSTLSSSSATTLNTALTNSLISVSTNTTSGISTLPIMDSSFSATADTTNTQALSVQKMKVFVNVATCTTKSELRSLMEQYGGPVKDIYIPMDESRRENRGYAFVTFREHQDAQKALKELNGYGLDGLILHPRWAKDNNNNKGKKSNKKAAKNMRTSKKDIKHQNKKNFGSP